ncbi:glycine-rich RNA-binding protein 10 [Tetranychus urticae]|uniref:RRM domain-containing protein n=1 Tax=Tetranychus urticae TaxID=32264 RepID=T1K7V4_TETUR|nr:glycine-rich RNA-binding protein 10 [Tetranychus urticae]
MPPIRCMVTNISWSVGRAQLREYFSRFGPLHEVSIKFNKETGLSEKYGFITFSDKQSFVSAANYPNDHFLEGSLMRIKPARES